VDALPDGLDALIVTSGGQCVDSAHVPVAERRLFGHVVAEELEALAGDVLPDAARIGVILAGDFYAVPELDRRGGLGDVEEVWRSFSSRFRWVAGVAGNHDAFGGGTTRAAFDETFARAESVHPMDGDAVSLDGLNLAGVSGVIGKSRKPWRHRPEDYRALAERALAVDPEVFVVHEPPAVPELGATGHEVVREALDAFAREDTLVVCGHRHWKTPVLQIPGGPQVLNVDFRVVVLSRYL